jgi:hypothetical protein
LARTTFGPSRLVVLGLEPNLQVDVYRIVRSDVLDDPVLENSLKSNYELSEPPRKVERLSTAIHMGISTYLSPDDAVETARKFDKLGDHVAHLTLRPGRGFNYARTGHTGHLTVWGDPVKLLESVVDIRPVSR